MLNPNMLMIERASQIGIEPEEYTSAYRAESLVDDPDFVPEIATPQEKRAA